MIGEYSEEWYEGVADFLKIPDKIHENESSKKVYKKKNIDVERENMLKIARKVGLGDPKNFKGIPIDDLGEYK